MTATIAHEAVDEEWVNVPLVALAAAHFSGREIPDSQRPFLAEPARIRIPSRRREFREAPIVVVEPHPDDASLSLGGLILSVNCPIHIVTVYSEGDSVHPQVRPLVDDLGLSASSLRNRESEAAARIVGATHASLGLRETDQRDPTSFDLLERNTQLIKALKAQVTDDALVLLPAAFGGHPDHRAALLCEAAFPLCALYEDIAPTRAYSRSTEEFWLRYDELQHEYATLYYPIDDTAESKVELSQIFRSQFSPRQARGLIRYGRAVGVSARHLNHEIPRGNVFERLYMRPRNQEAVRRWFTGRTVSVGHNAPSKSISIGPVALPTTARTDEVGRLFKGRRSERGLIADTISLERLAAAVSLCAGQVPGVEHFPKFPYPTTGGLGACTLSVLPWSVHGLATVVYQYQGTSHTLQATSAPLPLRSQLHEAVGHQDWVLGASVGFLVEADVSRTVGRYGSGAWQLLLLEAGHLAQALQMALCDMRMQCVLIPVFDKPEFDQLCPGRRPICAVFASGSVRDAGEPRAVWKEPSALSFDPLSDLPSRDDDSLGPNVDLRTRAIDLDGGGVFQLARCRIPTTNLFSTGWSVGLDAGAETRLRSSLATHAATCAVSEAREVFFARTMGGDQIVRGPLDVLDAQAVQTGAIIADARQIAARLAGRTALQRASHSRYWIRGADLISGAPVWLPTDAVLMDRRFFCGELLPTSCGLGCRPRIEDALRHATFEVFEKAIFTASGRPWLPAEIVSQKEEILVHALRARGQQPTLLKATGAGLVVRRVVCQPTGAVGTAVGWDSVRTSESALGECLAKVIDGVGHSDADTGPVNAGTANFEGLDEPNIRRFLEQAHLRLAWVQLHSVEGESFPLAGHPVVRVVAWRT